VRAWHFLPADRCTRYSRRPVRAGQTIIVHTRKRPLELCVWGLHACVRAIEALSYAPGPIACLVELGGEIIQDKDKVVATRRKCLGMGDATQVLYTFACDVAERALGRTEDPDPRSLAAVETRRRWLRGEATDAELSAAWSAARSAARSAAESAAWSAAENAAWGAAENAAWGSAWSRMNDDLEQRLRTLLGV
jgi:hypothetical protein